MCADGIKGINLPSIIFISEERVWRDETFATNFMKIGGAVKMS